MTDWLLLALNAIGATACIVVIVRSKRKGKEPANDANR